MLAGRIQVKRNNPKTDMSGVAPLYDGRKLNKLGLTPSF